MRGRTHRLSMLLTLALLLTALLAIQLPSVQAQNVAWVRQFGSSQHDGAMSVAVDPSGNLYVAGRTDGALPGQTSNGGPRDAFVRKLDPSGAEIWTRQFGTPRTDLAIAVAVDSAGSVYVAGQVGGALDGQTAAGELDAFVRKFDADGNVTWTRQFGGPGTDAAAGLEVGTGSEIYVVGWVYGALPGQAGAGQFDAFVRKYGPDGAEIWTRQFGTPDHDRASRVAVVATGDIEVAASVSRGAVHHDAYAHRFGSSGAAGPNRRLQAVGPTRRLQTADTEVVSGVALEPSGTMYVVGQTDTDHGHTFARKSDPDGIMVWERNVHIGDEETLGVDVAVDSSGDVYIAGQIDADVFVRKYDRNGTELWTSRLSTSDSDVASALVVDPSRGIYLVGWTSGTFPGQRSAGLSDAFVAKLR
jgi:hypothetical protein